MSVVWRSRQLGGGKESAAVEETKAFKFDSRAQLNEVRINTFLLSYLLTHLLLIYSGGICTTNHRGNSCNINNYSKV
jgi:hypothetical protein